MTYRYSRTDMLENPENYFYSNFEGKEFIKKWSDNRASYRDKYIESYDEKRLSKYLKGLGEISLTASLILKDLTRVENSVTMDGVEMDRLKKWIKMFENTKKIPDDIPDFRVVYNNKKAGNIINYILLAYYFEVTYRRLSSLICLNSLLKLMDIIVSQPTSWDHFELVADLSQREYEHVQNLVGKVKNCLK